MVCEFNHIQITDEERVCRVVEYMKENDLSVIEVKVAQELMGMAKNSTRKRIMRSGLFEKRPNGHVLSWGLKE